MIKLPPRHAVVIGIDKYEKPIAPLRTAVADARAVADVLKKPYGFNVLHQLLDGDATRARIGSMLESLREELDPKSHLVFYYAGHGVAESTGDLDGPQGFLYPQNAVRDDPESLLSMDELRAALAGLPCHHLLVVLDCCFGGSFRWASTRGLGSDQGQLYDSELRRFLDGTAWQVLTSAAHDEEAADVANYRDQEGERHSPFAAALLAGLAGNADSWRGNYPKDGVLTVTELYQYVEEDLSRKGWPQTPGLWPLRPENKGEFIFLDPKKEPDTRPDPPLDHRNNPWPEGFGNLWNGEPYEPPAEVGTEELFAIVERPAAEKALYFEPAELADELVDEAIGMPGALPLLARTLSEIYVQALRRRRKSWDVPDRALLRRDHRAVGGVPGTVRKLADELLEQAADEGLGATVRRVLLRMVSFEGWQATRRRILRAELQASDSRERKRVDTVVRRLLERRLVVADRERLELSHDALIRSWPPMADRWLEEAREPQSLLRDAWRAAREWDERGRAGGLLWDDDPRLSELRKVRGELNRLEAAFLQASLRRRRGKEKEARQVEDARRVALAGVLNAVDPTIAALVLLEVEKPAETPGAVAGMLGALAQPLTQAILQGHDGAVVSAAFNTDGTRVVTGSRDGTARVWNVESGGGAGGSDEPVVYRGHRSEVTSAGFSADGSKVLTVGGGTARVWNTRARQAGRAVVLKPPRVDVKDAAFSPDGTRVAVVGSQDGQVWLFRVAGSGQPVVLKGHQVPVETAAWNADGTRVVTAARDNTARVWNADGSGEPVVLEHESPRVESAVFNPEGTAILTVEGGTVRVWNADASCEPVVLRSLGSVKSTAYTADGTRVVTFSDRAVQVWTMPSGGTAVQPWYLYDSVLDAAIGADGTVAVVSEDWNVRVWDANVTFEDRLSGTIGRKMVLRGHRAQVESAALSADGTRVVTTSADGTARLWKPARPQEGLNAGVPVVLLSREGDMVHSAVFQGDGRRIVTAHRDGTARVWNADGSGEPIVLEGHRAQVHSAVFNAAGTRVVTTSTDWTARIWNVDGQSPDSIVLDELAKSAVFSADGTRILASLVDGTARVYHLDGRLEARFRVMPHLVGKSIFKADGRRLLMASRGGETVTVWNAESDTTLELKHGERGKLMSAAFDGDGTRVVTTLNDGTARVFHLDGAGGRPPGEPAVLLQLDPDLAGLNCRADFSPDGNRVITVSGDGPATVWNMDGSCELVLRGHDRTVASAVFSPDGTQILTACADGTARLWNVDRFGRSVGGQSIGVLDHGEPCDFAAFSPDGTQALTRSYRTVKVWPVGPGRLQAAIRSATSVRLDPELRALYLSESPAPARES